MRGILFFVPVEPMDDPFARAAPAQPEDVRGDTPAPDATPSGEGRLARRDPDAQLDESAEYHVTGAASFDDMLRRARRQGFLAGSAAGALGAAAIAGALALATARPVVTTTVALREPPGEVPRTERALAPGPPSSAAPTRTARTSRPGAVPAPILDAAVGGAVGRRGEPPAPAADRPVTELAVEEAKLPSAAPLAAPGRAVETPASLASPSGERPPEAEAVVGMDLSETPPAPGPGARAPEGESVAKRPFDERDVAAALRARRGDIDACVAATPGDAAAARGQSFLLAVVIDPTGKVSDAQIDDPEIEETPLGVCLVRLARAMSFSPFEGQPFRVELALNYGKAE